MHHMLWTMCFSLSARLFASGSMLKAFNCNPQLASMVKKLTDSRQDPRSDQELPSFQNTQNTESRDSDKPSIAVHPKNGFLRGFPL